MENNLYNLLLSKISIGTAQFGLDYGLGSKKKVELPEVKKILNLCNKNCISNIDTAFNYGDAHQVLSNAPLEKFQITSKVSSNFLDQDFEVIEKNISETIHMLGIDRFENLLTHDSQIFLESKERNINNLILLKKNGYTNSIGISIYEEKEAIQAASFFSPDIIQMPFNPLDQRLLDSKFILNLVDSGTKIQARSVFLQGLLLTRKIPPSFPKNTSIIMNKIEEFCKDHKISKLDFCLIFIAKNLSLLDSVVLGVDSFSNLKEIIDSTKRIKDKQLKENHFKIFKSRDLSIIDPRFWK